MTLPGMIERTMRAHNRFEPLVLFVGDAVLFVVSLWLTLALRHLEIPSTALFQQHIIPFAILFVLWALVFYVVGLYERHTTLLSRALPLRVFRAQLLNVIIAALFFFLVPYFSITPKTVLVIYLLVSTALVIGWRLYLFPFLNVGQRRPALLVGGGQEFRELCEEVNGNPRYHIQFVSTIDVDALKDGGGLSDKIFNELRRSEITVVVINPLHKKLRDILPYLHKPIYSNVEFIDANELYRDIFEREPLSAIEHHEGIFGGVPTGRFAQGQVALKRLVDIAGALVLGLLSLVLYPFVALAIKLEDGGPVFITQERVGKDMARIYLYKFRTMKHSDDGVWVPNYKNHNNVTYVGRFLRRSRIDELPQLWNILRGDLSFVGPRPDIVGLYKRISQEIPLYDLRYSVKPGLSGWAQIMQWYSEGNISPQSMDETKVRLQYDLYYIKNRSVIFDVLLMLRTIKVFVVRSGS